VSTIALWKVCLHLPNEYPETPCTFTPPGLIGALLTGLGASLLSRVTYRPLIMRNSVLLQGAQPLIYLSKSSLKDAKSPATAQQRGRELYMVQ
jgi:hypothetical protein